MRKSLKAEIATYLDKKEGLWAVSTIKSARARLNSLAEAGFDPEEVFHSWYKAGYSLYYIKQTFIVASRFEEEMLGTNFFKNFLEKNRSTFRQCYTNKTSILKRSEFESHLNWIRTARPALYNLLVLMANLGLRLSEALSVKWTDFTNDGFLRVTGKGGKVRLVPVKTKMNLNENTTLSVAGQVTSSQYRSFFKTLLPGYTPHDLRAMYANELVRVPGLTLYDAAMVLGHSDIRTTQKYLRSDLNRVKEILQHDSSRI